MGTTPWKGEEGEIARDEKLRVISRERETEREG